MIPARCSDSSALQNKMDETQASCTLPRLPALIPNSLPHNDLTVLVLTNQGVSQSETHSIWMLRVDGVQRPV